MERAITSELLIVGAHGVGGTGIISAAKDLADTTVRTISRRAKPPALVDETHVRSHIAVDLLDRDAALSALSVVGPRVDIAFSAYVDRPTASEAVKANLAILNNLLDGVERASAQVGHIVLITGGKAYGSHLGPYKTPARERDRRVMGPMFYYDQADAIREWADRRGAAWTEIRPDGIIGPSIGSPMNLLQGIAAFAAVSREQGIPLRFPGSFSAWSRHVYELTDTDLLGRAVIWALRADAARNQVFNLSNGDLFRWEHLWPEIAAFFEMDMDVPQPMSLTTHMAEQRTVWERLSERHGLVSTKWEDVVSWAFMDAMLRLDTDLIQSTIKIRQAGFPGCEDSHESFLSHLGRLRAARRIP